jgi:hypothetical protein
MKHSTVVERLVKYGPTVMIRTAALEGCTLTQQRCILATGVGVDTLSVFGIEAKPLSLAVEFRNRAWVDYVAALPEGHRLTAEELAEMDAQGAWVIHTGWPDNERSGKRDLLTNGWHGHLVIHVPNIDGVGSAIVDLDFRGFARPHKNITVPSAASFMFNGKPAIYNFPDGCALAIQPKPEDRTWEDAPDWRDHFRRERTVRALVQAIRKDSLNG